MKHIINAIFAITIGFPSASSAQSLSDHIEFCINGDATYRIDQQPMRDYCPVLAAGAFSTALAAPQFSSMIFGMIQRDWSRGAIGLACMGPTEQAAAVALLAACQCHNRLAADMILQNPGETLRLLRGYHPIGC
jgi:hypothetical protein